MRLNKAFSLGGNGFDEGILSSCHVGSNQIVQSVTDPEVKERNGCRKNVFNNNNVILSFLGTTTQTFFFRVHPSC